MSMRFIRARGLFAFSGNGNNYIVNSDCLFYGVGVHLGRDLMRL